MIPFHRDINLDPPQIHDDEHIYFISIRDQFIFCWGRGGGGGGHTHIFGPFSPNPASAENLAERGGGGGERGGELVVHFFHRARNPPPPEFATISPQICTNFPEICPNFARSLTDFLHRQLFFGGGDARASPTPMLYLTYIFDTDLHRLNFFKSDIWTIW